MGLNNDLLQISDEDTEEVLSQKLSDIRKQEKIVEKKNEAEGLGLDFISFKGKHIAPETISLIPIELAKKHKTVTFQKDGTGIKLATLEPQNQEVLQLANMLSEEYNRPVNIYVTSEDDFKIALEEYKNVKPELSLGSINVDAESIEKFSGQIDDFREIGRKAHQTSLSEFLNLVLAASIKIEASDIHFQPEKEAINVRFRVDGVLHDIFDLEPDIYSQVKKRIKLIAKLKINVENKPQDGSITINLKDKNIDLRISSLPSNYGESIVIRLLNPDMAATNFENLGLRNRALRIVQEKIKKTTGMIVSCGPTGSGKTTSLYTILKSLNKEGTQIITIENPIEYKLEGILQSQVSDELNFAGALKTALRQDPDIIMVGEIRDLDTAETAINAALTGHLVISTLHTNNAIGAIPRFLALGVKHFMLAPSLNMLMSQRLVRRLCPECKKPFDLEPEILEQLKSELAQMPQEEKGNIDETNLQFYKAVGCSECSGIGLRGRIGIFEVLDMNEEIVALIEGGDLTESTINELAKKQNMITMLQDGYIKAAEGITTVAEVLRVAG